jgi:hypothetical protein
LHSSSSTSCSSNASKRLNWFVNILLDHVGR